MKNIRSLVILASFVLCFVITVIYALVLDVSHDITSSSDKSKRKVPTTQFEQIKYYYFKQNRPALYMKADKLKMAEEHFFDFVQPQGKIYSEEGKVVYYRADEGRYRKSTDKIRFQGSVQMTFDSSEYESSSLVYQVNKGYLVGKSKVRTLTQDEKSGDKVEVFSDRLEAWPNKKESLHRGNVSGQIHKKRVYEEGFEFESNSLKAMMEESKVELNGNIVMKKQGFKAQAGRAEIFLENYNKKLKYYTLYDDIRIEEKLSNPKGQPVVRRAYAETLEGYNAERKIVLTGAPRVIQNKDEIKGYRITLRENVEIVEVDDANSVFTLKKD